MRKIILLAFVSLMAVPTLASETPTTSDAKSAAVEEQAIGTSAIESTNHGWGRRRYVCYARDYRGRTFAGYSGGYGYYGGGRYRAARQALRNCRYRSFAGGCRVSYCHSIGGGNGDWDNNNDWDNDNGYYDGGRRP